MFPWIVAGIGAFLIGLSKSGFAMGLGVLTTPMITSAMPAREALGIILPLLCFADLCTISVYWRKWDFKLIAGLLLGALPGIVVGTLLLGLVTEVFLRRFIGATTLIFLGLIIFRQIWSPHSAYRPKFWHSLLVGAVAGLTSMLSHAAGPIIALFLLAQRLDKTVFVATGALYFTLGNLMKVPPYIVAGVLTGPIFLKALWFFPLIPLGVWAGWWANRHISARWFNYLVYAMLFATAIHLLVKS